MSDNKIQFSPEQQNAQDQPPEDLKVSQNLQKEDQDDGPEISLLQMKNSNEIRGSHHFGEMRVSSEIRKNNDDMFFSKDESFFKNINNEKMGIFDKMFEKKNTENEQPETGFKKKGFPEANEKMQQVRISEVQENNQSETDDEEGPQPPQEFGFSDFNMFEKKDKKKEIIAVEESTQLPNIETQENNEFETIGQNPLELAVPDPNEPQRPSSPFGNFTRRMSGFHPDKLKSMNEDQQIRETKQKSNSNQDTGSYHNRQSGSKKYLQNDQMNVASVTSLGMSSHLKKDFTKDEYLMQKGYSQNLLRAMNEYSMVLDHIKSATKNQTDPYENVPSIFELKNVHKTYLVGMEGVPAIRGIDLKIYEGEFLMIYGKSGGGKSSLLNLIGTIDEPNKGSIYMEGKGFLDCLKDPQLSQIRLTNIGFVFQSFNLINSLTALENIKLPMLLKGQLSAKEAHERALSLMEELSILHRKDSYPKQMSGGEQQRVTIARAVANKPKMLLLDEPTGDLDSKNSLIVMKILLELNVKEKITTIMVTHDEHVKDLANRIVYVIDGKISKCVVNSKEKRRAVIDKLLVDAEQVKQEIKMRDAQAQSRNLRPKKVFRNPIEHPFFKHLATKTRT